MLSEPFERAKPIIETIERHNQQAYFVGGCVRDFLLNRPIGDVDITTSAPPNVIQSIFDKVIPVGIEHGTVVVVHDDIPYEVTTFRIEGDYSDKRHPDSVAFIDKIDKDLERRDFTINALAMDLSGNIIDLFHGKTDLENGIIQTVGNGYERFKEDPLRIIRALRFSSQLGFQIHADTLKQMMAVQKEIETLAVERITNEFSKLFAGEYVTNGLDYLNVTGSYRYLPVFKEHPTLYQKIPKSIKPLSTFGSVIALFHVMDSQISITKWIKAWKCSNKVKQEAQELVKALNYYQLNGIDNWLIYQLDVQYYEGFVHVINSLQSDSIDKLELNRIYETLPIKSRKDLSINGTDLINIFPHRKKGPWLQEMLSEIEKEVVFGKLANRKTDIKDWIKWNPPAIN